MKIENENNVLSYLKGIFFVEKNLFYIIITSNMWIRRKNTVVHIRFFLYNEVRSMSGY